MSEDNTREKPFKVKKKIPKEIKELLNAIIVK